MLDRLDRRGLISRGSAPGDRRAVLIELTPGGRQAADTIRAAIAALEHRALGGLPADTITGLRTALPALAEASSPRSRAGTRPCSASAC